MAPDLLSVIIPVRDVAEYVPDMLRSLALNAGPGLEFVVVDDGSADDTPQIVEDHRSLVPGLRLVRQERSLGVSAARNRGLAESTGRLVTYLDGDDWLAPGYLPELVAALQRLGCDFVRVDHVQVNGHRRVTHRAPEGRRETVLAPRDSIMPAHEPTMVDYPSVFTGIYRRELASAGLLTFDERLHTAEDRLWIWRLHLAAESYAVVSLAGVFYRRGVGTSLTQIGDERQLHFFDAFDTLLAELEGDPDADRLVRKAVRNYFAMIGHHLKQQDRLTPELRSRLQTRAAAAMRGVPAPLLAETLPSMGTQRMELFVRTLGIEVRD